jgi:hypothetical protein
MSRNNVRRKVQSHMRDNKYHNKASERKGIGSHDTPCGEADEIEGYRMAHWQASVDY